VQPEDVVYSVERLLKINQGPANLFAGVLKPGSVEAIDAKTVKFNLLKTFSLFLATVPAIRVVKFQGRQSERRELRGADLSRYLRRERRSVYAQKLGPRDWDDDRTRSQLLLRLGKGRIDEVRLFITKSDRALNCRLRQAHDVEPRSTRSSRRRTSSA
jgi:peptide/nickel transport system substrate-binding protein